MIIINGTYPSSVANIEGEFVAVFLIVTIVVSLLLSYTKHWNDYNSDVIDTCLYPALVTFAGIVIFKVMLAI